jgi:hypothetical protein
MSIIEFVNDIQIAKDKQSEYDADESNWKRTKIPMKGWLESINYTKKNLMDPENESGYIPFVINKILSGSIDCLFEVQFTNMYGNMSKRLHYDFLRHSVTKKRRFAPYIKKKEKTHAINAIKDHYNYSDKRAEEIIDLIGENRLEYIIDLYNQKL